MTNKSKIFLVTGSSGFIGFHICKTLLDNGHVVFGVDNLDDYYDVKLKLENRRNRRNRTQKDATNNCTTNNCTILLTI